MKKILIAAVLMLSLLLIVAEYSMATKPGEEVNPNGFPSGEHYNLNIIGKKADFTCPELQYDEYGNPIYGNTVFIPENGQDIQIVTQSGKGKQAATVTELQVIDPCTAAFDGDAAVIQLPKNDLGYKVYARVLAKPTDDPYLSITPDLMAVEDEFGNDLLYLGLVTDNGFETPFVSFTRTKGKSTAVDITGLFSWTGDVCYFTADYCEPVETCETMTLCGIPMDADGDGIADEGVYESVSILPEGELCPEGSVQVTAYCKHFENEWIFNIGELVDYLWSIDNNGVKLIQVRFYPNAPADFEVQLEMSFPLP